MEKYINQEELVARVKANFELFEDELSRLIYTSQVYYNVTGKYEYIGKMLYKMYYDYRDCIHSEKLLETFEKCKARLDVMWPLESFRVDLDNMYFEPGLIELTSHETFIDGGAKNLDTSMEFSYHAGDRFRAICAFEPDPLCFSMCEDNLVFFPRRRRGDIYLFNFGLFDREGMANFERFEPGLSKIVKDSKENIPVKTLDGVPEAEKATFIKMHTEGSEYEALLGGENIIKENKPVIACALYHHLRQMLAVPEFLHKLHPDYKFYMRHYSTGTSESVFYALPR